MATADVGIRIILQDSASAGFGALSGAMKGFGGLLGQLSYGWQNLSGPMQMAGMVAAGSGLLFAGFVSAIKYTVDAAAELEDAMVKVGNNVDGAGSHMSELQNSVTNLASTSMFSSTQIADGFAMLGNHGITATDILNTQVGRAMVNLAEVTGSDTVPAAQLLTGVLQMFNLKASDSTSVVDGLAYSFTHGVDSLAQMQQAYNQFAPLAAQLNISFQDSTAVLDVLNQKFNDGAVSGTAMKYILQSFVAPTVQAQNEFATLGIITTNQTVPSLKKLEEQLYASGKSGAAVADAFSSSGGTVKTLQNLFTEAQKLGLIKMDTTFFQWGQSTGILNDKLFDAKGNFIGLDKSLQLLSDHMKGLDPAQVATAVEQMFSKTGAKGALDLLNNYDKLQPKIQAIIDGLNKKGTAQQKAGDIEDTYNGRMKQLQTTFTTLAAQIGGPISEALKNFYFYLNTALSWFNNLPAPVHQGIAIFLIFGAVISGLTFVISAAIFLFGTMGTILLPVMGVVAVIVGVIALLTIGVMALVANWSKIAPVLQPVIHAFQQMGQFLSSVFGPVIKDLIGYIGGRITDEFAAISGTIQTNLVPAWKQFVTSMQPVMPVIKAIGMIIGAVIGGIIMVWIGILISIVGGLAMAVMRMAQGVIFIFIGLGHVIMGVIQVLVGIFHFFFGLFSYLTGNHKQGAEQMTQAWNYLKMGVVNIVTGLMHIVVGLFMSTLGAVIGFVQGFVTGIISFFTHLFNVLVGHSIIPDLVNGILVVFRFLWSMGVMIFQGMVSGIIAIVNVFHMGVLGVIMLIHAGFMLFWAGVQMVGSGIGIIFNGIKNVIIGAMNAVLGPIQMVLGVLHNLTNIGGNIGGLAHSLHIPGFASGGLVTQPTLAMIGEGGEHELVMPVSKLIAASQAAAGQGGGGGTNIVNLQLDGKNFLQVVIDQASGKARLAGATRLFK